MEKWASIEVSEEKKKESFIFTVIMAAWYSEAAHGE